MCCSRLGSSTASWFSALWASVDLLNSFMIVALIALVVILMATSVKRLILVPLVLLPAILLFAVYPFFRPSAWAADKKREDHLRQLDNLFVRSFCVAATTGFVVSLTLETLLTSGFVAVLFSAEAVKEARNAFMARFTGQETSAPVGVHLAMNFTTLAFVVLTSYVASATVEELVKAAVVRFNCCGRPSMRGSRTGSALVGAACGQPDHLRTPRATALLMVAAAVGMATMENMVYTLEDSSTLERGLGTALARALIALPMQVVASVLTAASFSRSDFALTMEDRWSWPMCLARAILFHGTFDLLVLGAPMLLQLTGASELVLTVVNFIVSLTTVLIGAWFAYGAFDQALVAVSASSHSAAKQRLAVAEGHISSSRSIRTVNE